MVNSFHEERFPEGISYGVTGGPEYITDIVTTKAGLEQRNLVRERGKCKYNAAHGVKNQNQYYQLLRFFRARKGKTYGFRFKDWLDFNAHNQIIGHGDGKTTVFQLIKTYADTYGEDVRKILKPVEHSVIIYVDGQIAKDWTCDYTTGKITFETAPQAGLAITADFKFDVPVRFDIDQMAASRDDFNNFSWNNIPLVELIDE